MRWPVRSWNEQWVMMSVACEVISPPTCSSSGGRSLASAKMRSAVARMSDVARSVEDTIASRAPGRSSSLSVPSCDAGQPGLSLVACARRSADGPEHALDLLLERGGVERLDDVVVDARLLGGDDVLGLALGGDHDERHVLE